MCGPQPHEEKLFAEASSARRFRFLAVSLFTPVVLAAYLILIRVFLVDLLLAAIFAGLAFPLFERRMQWLHDRRGLAASLLVAAFALAVALPAAVLVTLIASEAVQASGAIGSWLKVFIADPGPFLPKLPEWLGGSGAQQKAIAAVGTHIADITNSVVLFFSRRLSAAAFDTAALFLHLFVIAFGVVFFLQHGPALFGRIRERLPVGMEAQVFLDRTLQITAATLKSLLIIGAVQGALVGLAFGVLGLGQPWFWGTVSAAASALPAFGAGLVWGPAALYLLLSGRVAAGIALAIWGLLVVSTVDNVLRTAIVGRDAALPAFVVFLSTLGGIAALGAPGIVIGPVLAGLVASAFELYSGALRASGLLETRN
jgi:predicted PurR-regulated permease PerM